MKQLWIHIGLAKTATTTMQRMLFSRHPQIGYLGKNWIESERAKLALLHMARGPERKFDFQEIKSAFEELTQWYEGADSEKRILLLSEEDLTTFRFIDPQVCARRAKMVFPKARVLLLIREPIEWLQSMYFFRLSLRFPETLDGFNSWLKNGLERRFAGTDIGQIQIGTLLDTYVSCFGAENLTVLRYEDLVSDGRVFILTLSELLGVDPRPALTLFDESGDLPFHKLRITEAHKSFLEKYKLVILGCYREYLDELVPLVAGLEKRPRRQAVEMMRIDMKDDRAAIEAKLKAVSAFLDRACRHEFQEGKSASAEVDLVLKERVLEIWEPGARVIAAQFNSAANSYFSRSLPA